MNKVLTSIGTKVYYGFESTAGVRPATLSAYTLFADCTSHPDFNPEREPIETTTLVQRNNKTYTYGLKDYGTLEFGFNFTQEVLDLFLTASTGIIDLAQTNLALGKKMWIAIDIQNLDETFFVAVEPQDFGLPEGVVNSKYELTVRFTPIGDALWAADLTPAVYTVIFKDHDATVLKTEQVNEGEGATAPTDPTREGHTFTGWDVDFDNITADLTVTAQYTQD